MKTLKLMQLFFKKVKMLNFVLFLLFTLTIFLTLFNAGQYRYLTYARSVFQTRGLQNCVYFMNSYYFAGVLKSQGFSQMAKASFSFFRFSSLVLRSLSVAMRTTGRRGFTTLCSGTSWFPSQHWAYSWPEAVSTITY